MAAPLAPPAIAPMIVPSAAPPLTVSAVRVTLADFGPGAFSQFHRAHKVSSPADRHRLHVEHHSSASTWFASQRCETPDAPSKVIVRAATVTTLPDTRVPSLMINVSADEMAAPNTTHTDPSPRR